MSICGRYVETREQLLGVQAWEADAFSLLSYLSSQYCFLNPLDGSRLMNQLCPVMGEMQVGDYKVNRTSQLARAVKSYPLNCYYGWTVVLHAFYPSIWEAETGELQRDPVSTKQINTDNAMTHWTGQGEEEEREAWQFAESVPEMQHTKEKLSRWCGDFPEEGHWT